MSATSQTLSPSTSHGSPRGSDHTAEDEGLELVDAEETGSLDRVSIETDVQVSVVA